MQRSALVPLPFRLGLTVWTFIAIASAPTMAGTISLGFDSPVATTNVGNEWFVLEADGRIRVVETDGAPSVVRTIAEPGDGDGQLANPNDLVADPWGGVVVADAGNSRLARFEAGGAWVTNRSTPEFPQRLAANGSNVFALRYAESGLVVDVYDVGLNRISTLDVSAPCAQRDFSAVMGALAIDRTGAVWVTELTGCGEDYILRKYSADGTPLGSWSRPAGQLSPETLAEKNYTIWLVSDLVIVGDEVYVVLGAGGSEIGGIEADVWNLDGHPLRRVKLMGPARPVVRGHVAGSQLLLTDTFGTESIATLPLTQLP